MVYFRDKLFILWLLLLVFGQQLTAYTGLPSPDKLIAPFLVFMGLLTLLQASRARVSRVVRLMVFVFSLLLIKNISFIGFNDVYYTLMRKDIVNFGYFFVPLLCITNMEMFRKTGWIVVLISIVGCISPFLVSIDMITLPIGWFEPSRIGGLLKTKGLFLSNGDLAQYIVFATAWVILAPGIIDKKPKTIQFVRWILLASIILGLLSTQSRNVVVSLFTGLAILWWLKKSKIFTNEQKLVVVFSFVFFTITMFSIMGMFSTESYNTLISIGGESAKKTAETRLSQYTVAWEIFTSYPLLGADLEIYRAKGHLIAYIHNIWCRLLAHGGLITAITMLLLLMYSFKCIRQVSFIPEKLDESMVITAYFVSMLVSLLFYVGLGVMYWALFGVAAALVCIKI